MSARERLDRLLVLKGLAITRERAQALIMAGRVRVSGKPVDKAGTRFALDVPIEVVEGRSYVSRGGHKLASALDRLQVSVAGAIAADLGASTGGFTDCLLQRGARRVHALDVGRGLIDSRLRDDPRVVLHEGVNVRFLEPDALGEPVDLACADLSFISLRLVLPAVRTLLAPHGQALLLVKPQFELGRGQVGRGVVREPGKHRRAIRQVVEASRQDGFRLVGAALSGLPGAKGNREFFVHLAVGPGEARDLESLLAGVVPGEPPEAEGEPEGGSRRSPGT